MDDKNDDLVQSILNMHRSDKLFKIEMLRPSNRQVTNVKYKTLNSYHAGQSSKESETGYADVYKQQDDDKYLQSTNNMLFMRNDQHWDDMSDITACSDSRMTKINTAHIYQSYNFAYRPQIDLPILSIRNKIVSMIASNSVVVIRGSTGCGKTTQVPQLILDAEFQKKQHCNIIVTQPRRIAALSIAKRVSQERDWPVGTIVGYQMGLIKNTCRDTRITYCTTGVLLHKLINKKHMLDYTHIILDEVHERDEEMDFLLLVVKKLLRTNSPHVKVILMSATIDVDKFADYFSTPVEKKLLPAPIIDIPNQSPYNISIYYLDDVENLGNIPEISKDEPKFTLYMAEFSARIVHIFDRIDKKSDNDEDNLCDRPAVLIFLPGIEEIEDLRAVLQSEKNADLKWEIIILHSLISTEDQEAIFKKPPKSYRRIILSTNIAESSVTVPDVKYVIDFCMIKHVVTEPDTNYQCLQLCWASKSNCQQRAGRTGRVMNGRVYRMVPRDFYETALRDEATPEMLRIPLANAVLKTKLLNMGEPKALLALSLDPPNLSNLRSTILLLKETGALLNRTNTAQKYDGDLTPLGHVMASLPLDIHMTKLIILGYIFGILQDATIIAASMSVRGLFSIGLKGTTYQEKLYWAANSDSDNFASLNAYKVWRNDKAQRRITNGNQERQWAREKHLRLKSLREVDALVTEIMHKLRNFGIKENVDKLTWESLHVNRILVTKIVIAGAFYPNYFVKRPANTTEYCKNREKMLSLREPMSTVILRGWPLNQPGSLYSRRFQEIFGHLLGLKNKEDITVSFDGSSRVYIEYEKEKSIPNYCSFVRDCIKIRQCRIPIEIHLLGETEAHRRFKKLGLNEAPEKKSILFNSSNSQESSCIQYMYDQKPYPELPKQTEYRSKVILHGPESPLEAEVIHLTKAGRAKTVNIEASSVNSVLFDPCPDSPSGLFLVAQGINRHQNMSHLTLRNTTLLPNMPGLASLIALIFTPYMELRRSPLGTYYTGALCGLGYDSATGNGLYPEHDMEIIFDVEITKDDLGMINKLRHWMNIAMQFSDVTDNSYVDDNTLTEQAINCQNQIKNTFKKVIYKNRQPLEPVLTTKFDEWNRYDESLFLEPARETLRRSYVYGLHKALDLNARNDALEEEIKHLLQLEIIAHENPHETSIKPVFCKLCAIEICGIINLRAHLCSEQHTTKLRKIDTTAEFGDDIQSLLMKMRP